jgi:glycosyltransferase involved in cell wall biosynthesis
MKLSILIPTLPNRKAMLEELLNNLWSQAKKNSLENHFEVFTDDDSLMTIGEKRNKMLQSASGEFVVFIDDDDEISDDYLLSIIGAIILDPNADCVGMRGYITFDGQNRKQWSISRHHKTWHEESGIYFRTPNHISPVKTEIAKKCGFPSIKDGEDYAYSMAILPYLEREIFIDKEIYHYKYVSKK